MRPIRKRNLEAEFSLAWKALCPGVILEKEVRFHPVRRWRFDFAHKAARVAVELEGVHKRGPKSRHQTLEGYSSDCEKYNAATHLGWAVYRLTRTMITLDNLKMIHEAIERRS